jgi:hypothetical protein
MTITEILQLVAIFVALGGLFRALYEYHSAQKWKRLEFASQFMRRLDREPVLKTATMLLDFNELDLVLPKEAADCHLPDGPFHHSIDKLFQAMSMDSREASNQHPGLDFRREYDTPEFRTYVWIFDELFEYLSEAGMYIRIGLIQADDVPRVRYWLRKVRKMRFKDHPVFQDYLTFYNFEGLTDLPD